MKKTLFFTLMLALAFSFNAMSQLGQIGLIGSFNGWSADHDVSRDLDDPFMYTTFLTVAAADTNDNGEIDVKFRENAGWDLNWGGVYPSGTGLTGGDNIILPEAGTYYVTFEAVISTDTVVTFGFTKTYGSVGLVGTINGWGSDGDDYILTRSATAMDEYYGHFTITVADTNDDGNIEVKFRENQDWTVNWGAADFPSGIATDAGANIAAEAGNYKVTFNSTTGAYNFISTAGQIGLVGEFNGWGAPDHQMTRDMTDPDLFTTVISFTKDQADGDDTVQVKFRQNEDWGVNWGSAGFPTGTGTNNGANIMVPIDTNALTTDFAVSFEYNQISGTTSEAAYTFTPASGVVSMIGAFNNWAGDFPMMRDANDPNVWTATRSFSAVHANDDGIVEVKFRQNADWTVNWGHLDFPTGTGEVGGGNIQLVPGTYDITFNATTLAYSFVDNTTAVGEISMLGDFNEWGASEDVADIFLVRDAMHPTYFTLTHNFESSTGILFRENEDAITGDDIWGGTFPSGTATQGNTNIIKVPGGLYDITFDANSGDFSFVQLGNSINAAKVFAMSVDGMLDEADWSVVNPIAKVADGTAPEAPMVANFGAVYNADNLFVGLEVGNALIADATVDIFVDGDKSGGAFDEHDVVFSVAADGTVTVLEGTATVVAEIVANTDTSYVLEASIAWTDLDVEAIEGEGIGFDIIISDGDVYKVAWNGGMGNYDANSMLGAVSFGGLSCGCISIYNETIGDVVIRNTVAAPTTYVGTYNLDDAFDLVFRKDKSSTVTWGDDSFPTGTATVGGPQIPATANRYRVTFDCVTGTYNFAVEEAVAASTVYGQYTSNDVVIDGDLSEYALDYDSEVIVDQVVGDGNNNTVTWGITWDENNMYIGINVVDAVVEGAGNPWENDAIEMYIDGDNSKDGAYSGEFDTQLIMDHGSNTADGIVDGMDALWVKADGVPVTNFNSKWLATSSGYAIEVRLGWDNFDFTPGNGRIMGFSLGNNDSDNGTGRDFQTVWYGTASNWSNTGDLGDLELAGGPYNFTGIIDNDVLNNANIDLYPNPTSGNVYLRSVDEVFNGNVSVYVIDITGKVVVSSLERISGSNDVIEINTSNLLKGIYLVNVVGTNGERAVKKLIIQ